MRNTPSRRASACSSVNESTCTSSACERKREELIEMLAHQQRVAQAGLITAGLAHDVGNHVQSMSGAVFLALNSERPSELREVLEEVQKRCCALTDLTRAFLSFVRRRDGVLGRFSAADTVEEVCRLVRPLAKDQDVTLECATTEDARIEGERQLVVQSVVNLVSNAIRACGSGGRVSVRVSRPLPSICRVEVADDGAGIPDEVRSRLFRPFSTTHDGAGGNGLGLFIVRRSIRKLGGSIRVTSSSDGTIFAIDLPVAD